MSPPVPYPYSRRREAAAGISLLELLIVVVLIGFVSLFAIPRVRTAYDRAMVRSAHAAVTNLFNSTRTVARASNQVAVLQRTGNVLVIQRNAFPPGTSKDTVGGIQNLLAQFGVTLTGPDSIRVDPRGLLRAPNTTTTYTWGVTRNGQSDSVIVNAYGRVLR